MENLFENLCKIVEPNKAESTSDKIDRLIKENEEYIKQVEIILEIVKTNNETMKILEGIKK